MGKHTGNLYQFLFCAWSLYLEHIIWLSRRQRFEDGLAVRNPTIWHVGEALLLCSFQITKCIPSLRAMFSLLSQGLGKRPKCISFANFNDTVVALNSYFTSSNFMTVFSKTYFNGCKPFWLFIQTERQSITLIISNIIITTIENSPADGVTSNFWEDKDTGYSHNCRYCLSEQ